jgi:hypothetical protein
VGGDAQVADAGIGGEHEVDEGGQVAGPALLVEEVGDGGGADGHAAQSLGQGGVEQGRADLIEQAEQVGGLAGERVPADGEGLEEGGGLGTGLPEAIAPAEVVGAPLRGGERGEVRLVVDPLAAVVTPHVAGDLGGAVEEADEVFTGHQGEGPPDQRMRDRVVVAIEADVRGLARAHGPESVAGEGMFGERQEPGLLVDQGGRHALLPAIGDRARVGHLDDPARQLRIEIGHGGEGARGKERMAEEADKAFDAPLLGGCQLPLILLNHRRFGSPTRFIPSGGRASDS